MTSKKTFINSLGIVRLYFLLAAGGGIFTLLWLLVIPTDKRNSTVFGYSPSRMGMLIFMSVGIIFFMGLLINTFRKPKWVQGLIEQIEPYFQSPNITGFFIFAIPLLTTVSATLGGIIFAFFTITLTDEFILGYLTRLAPIVIWITVLAILTLFLLIFYGYPRKVIIQDFQLAFSTFKLWLATTNLYRLLGISIIFCAIVFSLVYALFPDCRPSFVEEDLFLENLTTGLFLFSLLLSVFFLVLNRGGRWIDFAVPAASLISFLEEISYGERYSEAIPMMVPEKDIDAFHDYFKVGYRFIKNQENDFFVFILGGISIILLLLAGFFLAHYIRNQKSKNKLVAFGPLIFTLIGAIFISIAQVLDLNVLAIPEYTYIEEMLELFTAISLFFAAISIYQRIAFEKQKI